MNGTVTPAKKAVGKRLERLREVFGFKTKAEFAAWLGLRHDTYSHYAAGRNRVPEAVCAILKDRKGVTADWLLHGDTAGLSMTLFQQIFPDVAITNPRHTVD